LKIYLGKSINNGSLFALSIKNFATFLGRAEKLDAFLRKPVKETVFIFRLPAFWYIRCTTFACSFHQNHAYEQS